MLFEHGFYLKKPKLGLICMHDVTLESVVAVPDHFAYASIGRCMRIYDVVAT